MNCIKYQPDNILINKKSGRSFSTINITKKLIVRKKKKRI